MVCPNCGAQLPPDAQFCTQCGVSLNASAAPGQNVPVRVNTYLIPNILVTVLCGFVGFGVTGIVGVIFSILSNNACSRGDVADAITKANVAKILFWISVVGGIVGLIYFYSFFSATSLLSFLA